MSVFELNEYRKGKHETNTHNEAASDEFDTSSAPFLTTHLGLAIAQSDQ